LNKNYEDKSLDYAMKEMKAADHTVKPRKKRQYREDECRNSGTGG
jgi:hypothetical protein